MDGQRGSTDPSLSDRLAAWTFGAYVAVALPLVVFSLGTYFWFLGDDWDFLTQRDAGSLADLVRPHAEHLSALPIVVYRAEWHLFGFHYWRYQFVVMVLHLTVAVLLRVLLRRAGVSPWIASAAAAMFVLFSPGYENMLWSFQLAWVMTLSFGFLHLIAADHDAPRPERRDWLGLACGLAAVLSAGVAPVMVGVVGIAAFLRRGWRMAAFHTAPLAAIYVTWFVANREHQPETKGHVTPSALVDWMHQGYTAIFAGLGGGRPLGIALAVVLVAGLVLAWGPMVSARRWTDLRRTASIPLAMALGSLAFQAATANSRWAFGAAGARTSRYVYVGALLLIPLIAVAADAIARRWRHALPVMVLLLLAPIPSNINGFDADGEVFSEEYFDRSRLFVEAIAWSPLAEQVPRDVHPIRDWLGGEGPSVGWLLDARRADRIHRPDAVPPDVLDEVEIRLGIAQTFADDADPPETGRSCVTHDGPVALSPAKGDRFTIETPMGVRLAEPRKPVLFASAFTPLEGSELEIVLDGLELVFAPLAPDPTFTICS